MNPKTKNDNNHLAYRVRRGVHHHSADDSLSLVLNYPLKVFMINPIWQPVIRSLASGSFIPFKKITHLIEIKASDQVESFLDELVRKGFLESRGYRELDEYPSVSIIIPVRNRPLEIGACLESLARLDYPLNKVETIVVDDASMDHTPEVIRGFGVPLISLNNQRQASFCRNLAAGKAKGEILAFLDSDCTADPKWLKALVPAFMDRSTGAVGGLVDSANQKKKLDQYEKVKSSLNMGPWPMSSREQDLFFYLPSCNLLIRNQIYRELGGFQEDLHVGEDVDLCWRMRDLGWHIEYMPNGIVYHKHRNEPKSFCARRFDYGTSEPLLQYMHDNRIKKVTFSLSNILFWGSILLSIILGQISFLGFSALTILIHSIIKYKKILRLRIPVGYLRILTAIFRGYLTFMYNLCSFASRYYLVFAFPLIIVTPVLSAILLGMHLVKGIVEYTLKKPDMNPLSFLLYFTLEQLAYQTGVWWGCVKSMNFQPVNPHVIWQMM